MPVLETLTRELAEAIREAGLQEVKVVCCESSSEPEGLQWCCGRPSPESEGHFYLGASREDWDGIGGTPEALLRRCIERLSAGRPEAKLVAFVGTSEVPPREWPRVAFEINHSNQATLSVYCVLSPALESAMGTALVPQSLSAGYSAVELLAQVQVPVSVSFGGTQIRMKDLLNLSTGSVVELDQTLNDSVEVRVNDCLIARGEVVAVDGHYGVRVLEMLSGGANAGKGIRTK